MKYIFKKHYSFSWAVFYVFLLACFLSPSISLAQIIGGETGGGNLGGQTGSFTQLWNPLTGIPTIQALVAKLLEIVVQIGVPIVIFFLVYVGFLFVTARGNPEKISIARNAFMWTVIGGVVLLGAQLLSSVVENTVRQITG